MKVGVFDSGVGGLSVVESIKKSMPELDMVYASDPEHVPYGDKAPSVVLELVTPILQKLAEEGCDAIVIACNTVTTHHIETLRQRIAVPLVGIEPMVKPAAKLTSSNIIAVCATPATLDSKRYDWLKRTYASHLTVLQPDCSRWAYMIEHNRTNELVLSRQITELCDQGADVIVLGCTHYHWIEEEIRQATRGRAAVIQSEQAVIKQLWRVLEDLPRPV